MCHLPPIFKWWKKYEGKKLWLWKFYHQYRIAGRVYKRQKIEKIILRTFLKYFSKIGVLRPRFADFRKIFQQFSENILKMLPKLFFRFFGIFILGPQFCTCGEIFITIAFFLHIFFTIWKLEVDDTSAIDYRSWGMSAIYLQVIILSKLKLCKFISVQVWTIDGVLFCVNCHNLAIFWARDLRFSI